MTRATALVLEGARRLSTRTFTVPPVGDDDAVLAVEACGLCGTDHEQWSGVLFGGRPLVPGHETIGRIESIGRAARRRWGVEEGERVAVEVFQRCGSCPACVAGAYQRCEHHGLRSAYGFVSAERRPGLWGGYATHQYLAPDSQLLPVPPSLDPVVATLFNPLGAGIRWGVTLPGTAPGDIVAVLGPGIRGLSTSAAAREAGAGLIMVTGRGNRDAPRLSLALHFGADLVVDAESADPVAALQEATGGRLADVVVDVTANAPSAFTQAVALARPGGTIVVAGTRGFVESAGFHPDLVVYRELRILGALGVDTDSYRAALHLLGAGTYPFESLPRQVASFDEVGDLLGTMAGEAGPPPVHGVFVP
ncbi:MAG: zinc-dependent alcohol dehydrogenase [Acidimicrobiales bacterium]